MPVVQEKRTQFQAIAELSRVLSEHHVFCIRITGASGSGKTTLLDATIAAMPNVDHVAVLSLAKGDQQSNRSIPSEYKTAEEGHEAEEILEAIESWNLDDIDVLFIESDPLSVRSVGEHATVVLFSATGPENLPLLEPHGFLCADLCLITKTDVLGDRSFNLALASRNVARVRPGIQIIEVSSVTGEGLDSWLSWAELRKREALEAFELKRAARSR